MAIVKGGDGNRVVIFSSSSSSSRVGLNVSIIFILVDALRRVGRSERMDGGRPADADVI